MNIKSIEGLTFNKVERVEVNHDDQVHFYCGDRVFKMLHFYDCYEDVWISDINGDLQDLVGVPILVAEAREEEDTTAPESGTWTFYTIRTIKGSVDITWRGHSNGYYSESIDFVEA